MVTRFKQSSVKSFKVEFDSEPATSFGGLALVARLAARLGLWTSLDSQLPLRRNCTHQWLPMIQAAIAGLLSGSRGTYAAEPVRADGQLQKLFGMSGVPEEATLWRMLGQLSEGKLPATMRQILMLWARKMIDASPRSAIERYGFALVFGDGSLLEGSRRREGSKWIDGKGHGLLWSTLFVGPFMVAQRLCEEGKGENTTLREMLPEVVKGVLKPMKLHKRALVLLDSLHGDEPTLRELDKLKLHYIVGANKLKAATAALEQQPDDVWHDTGARADLGWSASGACQCWVQCAGWPSKRLLVGRRWKNENEFVWRYSGVITAMSQQTVEHVMKQHGIGYAEAIWKLYDLKAGAENNYLEPLEDLGLHHPPCHQIKRNQAFYDVAALALMLGRGVDVIGGQSPERGSMARKDGGQRKRPKPRSMRLWRLRRTLLALPARISIHARQATVRILGANAQTQALFDQYWSAISRC